MANIGRLLREDEFPTEGTIIIKSGSKTVAIGRGLITDGKPSTIQVKTNPRFVTCESNLLVKDTAFIFILDDNERFDAFSGLCKVCADYKVSFSNDQYSIPLITFDVVPVRSINASHLFDLYRFSV